MKFNLKYLILLAALTSSVTINSYSKEFKFYYDFCPFKYEDNRIFLEFYYSFYQNQLEFIKSSAGYEAAGLISINLKDIKTNKAVIQKQFKVPIVVPDTIGYNKNSTLTGQLNFLLDSGNYVMKIIASDFNDPSDSISYDETMNIVKFPDNKFVMSGIQLSNSIQKSTDQGGIFYKNTLEVVPNPTGLFGNNLSSLYYYFEMYNLSIENLSENYSIITEIADLNDNPLKSQEKKATIKSQSKVEYGSFVISDLKTNTYKLIVKIIDNKNTQVSKNEKKFRIYNADTSITNTMDNDNTYLFSEYSSYSDELLNAEFKYALYIADKTETEQFENIKNTEGKRKFMFNFWKNKPVTKKEYLDRIKFANKYFKYDFREGYSTDRGRIYCIYGKPNDIEKYPFQANTREYEIWHYDAIQGGVIFVFVDMSNDGANFVMVHSTARNEFRNDDWMNKLLIVK